MKIFLVTLTSVLILALAGVAVYLFIVMGERDDLQKELTSTLQELETTRTNLASTQTELATTENTLSSTQSDLTATQDTLTTTENELASTVDELSATEDELATTKQDLLSTEGALDHAQTQLADKEQELEEATAEYWAAIETLQALDIAISTSLACIDAELVDNPDAVNPTWAELKAFLAEDRTEQHEYILDVYDCSEFSRDLHNRAEAAGIRAAVVHIDLAGETVGHALNAFITTDYGLVYVDCTGPPDTIARIKSQYEYRSVAVPNVSIQNVRDDSWWASLWSYYYIPSSTGAHLKVNYIIIYW